MKRARCLPLRAIVILIVLLGTVGTALAQTATIDVVDRLDSTSANTRNTMRVGPGETIYVRIVFTGVAPEASGLASDSVNVTVQARYSSSTSDDEEYLTLTRRTLSSAPLPWAYTGSIKTARKPNGYNADPTAASALYNNGTLDVRGRDQILIGALDATFGTGTTYTVTSNASAVYVRTRGMLAFTEPDSGAADGPAEISQALIGDYVYVRVDDDDRNTDPATPQSFNVTVRDLPDPGGDFESVLVTETGDDTGIFIGKIPTRYVASSTVLGNNILEKTTGNNFRLDYEDPESPGYVPVLNALLTKEISVQTGGSISASAPALQVGVPLQIVVTDAGLNNPNSSPTASVTVRVTQTGGLDSETVVLGSQDGHTFRGTLPWVYGNSPRTEDGVMTISLPQGGANTLQVSYVTRVDQNGVPFQATSAAPVIPSAGGLGRIRFVTRSDDSTSPYSALNALITPYDTLFVRVEDTALFSQPIPGANSVTVTAYIDTPAAHANSQVILARELPSHPGWFVGAIPTTLGNPSSSPDGTLHVRGGDTINAAYADTTPTTLTANNTPRVATVSKLRITEDGGSGVVGPAGGSQVKIVRAGEYVTLVVDDDDRIILPLVPVTVRVTSTTGDVEDMTLTQVGSDTGIFTGRLKITYGVGAGINGDGSINVVGSGSTDSLWATYTDPYDPTGVGTMWTAAAVASATDGTIAVTPNPIVPGSDLTIDVSDADAYADVRPGPGNDSVRVTVTSYSGNPPTPANLLDAESVELSELASPDAAGLFRGVVPLAFSGTATRNDGVLTVTKTGTVIASYVDALRSSGQSDFPVETGTVLVQNSATSVSAVRFVNSLAAGASAQVRIQPGDTVNVSVSDSNSDLTDEADSITVNVTTTAGDSETVRLVETGPHTGDFTGWINSGYAATVRNSSGATVTWGVSVVAGNGNLEVKGRDYTSAAASAPQLYVTYTDSGGGNSYSSMAVDIDASVLFVSKDAIPASGVPVKVHSFAAGDTLFMQVDDDDWNRDPATAETITVTLTSWYGTPAATILEQKYLTLTETGASTGVFTTASGIKTLYSATALASDPNTLAVYRSSSIGYVTVDHGDNETSSGTLMVRRDQIDLAYGLDGQITTVPATGGTLYPSQNVSLSIVDTDTFADRTTGPGNDTVRVTVTSYTGAGGTGTVIDEEVVDVGEDVFTAGLFLHKMPVEFVPNATNPGFANRARDNDGQIQVASAGSVRVCYHDAAPANGQAHTSVQSIFGVAMSGVTGDATIHFVSDTSGLASASVVSRIGPGDTLNVSVSNKDYDLTPDVDHLVVAIATRCTVASRGGYTPYFADNTIDDLELVELTETGPRTGVFTGSIATTLAPDGYNTSLRKNGVLEVRGQETYPTPTITLPAGQILARYQDAQAIPTYPTATMAVDVDGDVRVVENVSASGAPRVAAVRIGETVFVQVKDDDANVNPTSLDTVDVTLTSNSDSPVAVVDTVVVRLYETGNNSGIFRITSSSVTDPNGATPRSIGGFVNGIQQGVPTQFLASGTGTADDGILQMRTTNSSDALNTVVVQYADNETRIGAAAKPSDTVTARKGTNGTVAVTDPSSSAPTTTLYGGDELAIAIDNETDCSLSAGPGNDTLTVTLTSYSSGGSVVDIETLVTHEDPSVEGDFSGLFPAVYSSGSPVSGNGQLEVVAGGTVVAAYTDFLRSNGQPWAMVSSTALTVGAGATATVSFISSKEVVAPAPLVVQRIEPGDTLYIRVVDRQADTTLAGHTNTVTVNVTTTSSLDSETIVCQETTTPGTFVGEIQTRFGQSLSVRTNPDATENNGILEVRGRDQALATYYRSPATTSLDVEINGSIRAQENRSSGAGEITTVHISTDLVLRVADDDLNTDPTVKESIAVPVTMGDPILVDSENVTLTETGVDTGVFTGGIPTRLNAIPVAGDGYLDSPAATSQIRTHVIRAAYTDSRVPYPVNGTMTSVLKDLWLDALFGVSRQADTAKMDLLVPLNGVYTRANDLSQVIAGAPLTIVVEDPDADVSPTADKVSVTITVTTTAQGSGSLVTDQEVIQLTETDPSSGVFRGNSTTNFGPKAQGDGLVSLSGYDFVTVRYWDSQDSLGQSRWIRAQAQVAPKYQDDLVANNVSAQAATLNLSNGARFYIPANSVYKSINVEFQLHYGASIQSGGDPRPKDESGNFIPLPLDPSISLVLDQGKAIWYDLRPSGETFKKPAQIFIPVPTQAHVSGSVPPLTALQKSQIKVVFFDGFEWNSVGGSYKAAGSDPAMPDPTQDYVVATTNHLTTYALAVDARTLPAAGGPLISSVSLNNNPFTPNGDGANDATTIRFGLSEDSLVSVKVFDSNGDVVRTLVCETPLSAGYVSESWDGSYLFSQRKVPAGLYVMEVRATGSTTGRKAKETILVGVMK